MKVRVLPLILKSDFWSFQPIDLLLCILSGTFSVGLFFLSYSYSFVYDDDLYTLAFFIVNIDAMTADVPYLDGSSFIMNA